MKWASSISRADSVELAVGHAAVSIAQEMGDLSPDLAMAFVSPGLAGDVASLIRKLEEQFPSAYIIGCTAGGVIGGGEEEEHVPALSLTCANLPGVDVIPIYTDGLDLPDGDAPPQAWRDCLGIREGIDPHFVIMADPFSPWVNDFIEGLDYVWPDSVKVGGIASGGKKCGENALFTETQVHHKGVVAVALSGNIAVSTAVAQGCRPIGEALRITDCETNVLMEVEGERPLHYLQRLSATLSEEDRELMSNSLFVGIDTDPFPDEECIGPGDYIIRNLIGIDKNVGALVVNENLHVGRTVQFHVRDKVASAEDLKDTLSRCIGQPDYTQPEGALLFSCMGRGEQLYGVGGHDSGRFRETVGEVPLGGFFCNGEIGPVGGTTYIHGYTSAFGLFRPAR
jgi:small ligand-binding sensory domain FIST